MPKIAVPRKGSVNSRGKRRPLHQTLKRRPAACLFPPLVHLTRLTVSAARLLALPSLATRMPWLDSRRIFSRAGLRCWIGNLTPDRRATSTRRAHRLSFLTDWPWHLSRVTKVWDPELSLLSVMWRKCLVDLLFGMATEARASVLRVL